jgi:hypothetical protein
MRNPAQGWKYSSSMEESRREVLSRPFGFDDLVRRVVEDMKVIRAIAALGRDRGLTDCIQPVFFIELPKTGDVLFNGSSGYRAQYWMDPWRGLEANAQLISALKPGLLASVDIQVQPNLAKIDVCASLDATSAKVWIREAPSTMEHRVDLDVEPWTSEAARGVELAQLGLAAPQIQKFEVKGALLDPFGNERVPARKIRRHFDIHHYGFS